MAADCHLLSVPEGQKWGAQREEEYCFGANSVHSIATSGSSSQMYSSFALPALAQGSASTLVAQCCLHAQNLHAQKVQVFAFTSRPIILTATLMSQIPIQDRWGHLFNERGNI